MTPSKIKPPPHSPTFQLVMQCLNQLGHHIPLERAERDAFIYPYFDNYAVSANHQF
jgi:hypothetical protein